MAALGVFQRATARELWPLVLPHQRGDKSIRDALGDLDDAGKVRKELTLPDGRKFWCLTPAGRRDAAALLPAGTKLAAARPVRDKPTAAYSEHALDVAATAGLLAKAGIGHLEAFSTEVEHRLPGRRVARPGDRAGRPDAAGPAGTGRRGRLQRPPVQSLLPLQCSPCYPAGQSLLPRRAGLRFARVVRYRPDKSAAEAETVPSVRKLATAEGL